MPNVDRLEHMYIHHVAVCASCVWPQSSILGDKTGVQGVSSAMQTVVPGHKGAVQ